MPPSPGDDVADEMQAAMEKVAGTRPHNYRPGGGPDPYPTPKPNKP